MPGYQVKQQRIAVTGVADLVITSLFDRQQFSDPHGEAERLGIGSAQWSLFGLLWPSAQQLAARLAARALRPGERILEMGCGLALASIVGHRRGADVTASDKHPLTARFLAHNLRLNRLPPMAYRHGEWALAAPGSLPLQGAVRGRYGLLIASDVLYERGSGALLAAFIGRHATPTAEVWIVDPDRGNRPAFVRAMAALGFVLREERLDQAATALAVAYKGRLLTYMRERESLRAAAAPSP
jgi:predicted nicotinamide N-methyase